MSDSPHITYGEIDLDLEAFGNGIQLSGAIFHSDDHGHIAVMFPDENATHFGIFNLTREQWTAVLRQTDLVETTVLAKASEKDNVKVAKAVLRKTARRVDNNVSWQVFRRDGFACRYCGADDVPLTVDHLVLWEEGGPWTPENLVTACRKCNKSRGNMQYGEWLKHPRYLRTSQNLTSDVRAQNEALLGTLDAIPRNLHISKSR